MLADMFVFNVNTLGNSGMFHTAVNNTNKLDLILTRSLYVHCLQGNQIGQFFANLATFGGSL